MAVEEVGMTGVDVNCLHGNEIADEFVRRVECFAEEGDDDGVEAVFELWVTTEELFGEELAEDANQFVIDK